MPRIDLKEDYGVTKARTLAGRGFGVERGGYVILHPVEVAYLSTTGNSVYSGNRKLGVSEVLKWCFRDRKNVLLFFVFRDLRSRGKRVRVLENLVVGREVYRPVSEREVVDFQELYGSKSILAVVDEEGDVTYYRTSTWDCYGNHEEKIDEFNGIFAGDRVVTDRKDVFEKYFYGSMKDGVVTLSLIEAFYLLEEGKLKLDVSKTELLEAAKSVEENFEERYLYYRDLKERMFVVKTGFKFGSDFRVYEKVESCRDLPHSKYLVKVAEKMKASEMASHVRVANAVRKKMVFCFSGKYLCVERVRV